MADLFLSHSSSDVDAVRRLRQHLESGGYSCWMAPDDVSSAEPWAQQIVDAIQTSRVTVVLLSERSIASDHVSREVGLAVQAGKPVLPVRIERVLLSGTLAYLLHLTQWVDAFPGPIDTHVNDIGGRVADLVRPRGPGAPPVPPREPVPPAPGVSRPPATVPPPSAGRDPQRPGVQRVPSRLPGLGVVLGGVAVAAASILPWATATIGPASISLNGLDREGVGVITGALGMLLVVLGLLTVGGRSRLVALLAVIVAVVAGLMGVAEALYQRQLDVVEEGASFSLGFGLLVLIAGAAVAAVSAALALGSSRAARV